MKFLFYSDGNEEDIHLRTMQEEFFVLYSHERIMGLLGAMIPEPNKVVEHFLMS